MPSAPREPVATSPAVDFDHMVHHVDPALEIVTSQSSVWETHRTVQWTPIAETAVTAIITMTTVLRGNARPTTPNANSTSVSSISSYLYSFNENLVGHTHFVLDSCSNCDLLSRKLTCAISFTVQIQTREMIDVTLFTMITEISLATVATLRQLIFLVLLGENTCTCMCKSI